MALHIHNYRSECRCGTCHQCGQQIEAHERDEELAGLYAAELATLPTFLSELCPNDEECAAIGKALAGKDQAEVGRIYHAAAVREADEAIRRLSDDAGLSLSEAGSRLCRVIYAQVAA